MPLLNGINHDEERIIVTLGLTVSGGTYVPIPAKAVTADSYQRHIASVLGVTDARAAAITAEYPLNAYPSPPVAFSVLVGDANFARPALQMDKWTSQWAPPLIPPPVATHLSQLPYLFDLPDAPFQEPLSPDQHASGLSDPSSAAVPWPSFGTDKVMSLVPPQPQVESIFGSRHHCSFWAA